MLSKTSVIKVLLQNIGGLTGEKAFDLLSNQSDIIIATEHKFGGKKNGWERAIINGIAPTNRTIHSSFTNTSRNNGTMFLISRRIKRFCVAHRILVPGHMALLDLQILSKRIIIVAIYMPCSQDEEASTIRTGVYTNLTTMIALAHERGFELLVAGDFNSE